MNYWGLLSGGSVSTDTTSCVKAIAPEILQGKQTIATGTGSAAAILFDRAGLTGAEYVELTVTGCNDVLFTINYLDGADCDSCTPDTIVEVAQNLLVRKGETRVLPQGLVADITYVAVDTAGVAFDVLTDTDVSFYAVAYASPCCASPIVA